MLYAAWYSTLGFAGLYTATAKTASLSHACGYEHDHGIHGIDPLWLDKLKQEAWPRSTTTVITGPLHP